MPRFWGCRSPPAQALGFLPRHAMISEALAVVDEEPEGPGFRARGANGAFLTCFGVVPRESSDMPDPRGKRREVWGFDPYIVRVLLFRGEFPLDDGKPPNSSTWDS